MHNFVILPWNDTRVGERGFQEITKDEDEENSPNDWQSWGDVLGQIGTVKGEEKSRSTDDEEQGHVENTRLSSHDDSSIAVETVFSREHLPFSRYFWHFMAHREITELL